MKFGDIVILVIILVIILAIILGIGSCTMNEINWNNTEAKPTKCNLTAKNYKGSTVETHAVPTINSSGGVGVGIVSTGDAEEYISSFECEGIGSIISTNKAIFIKAKPNSILLIKVRKNDYRIEGILD